MITNKIIIGSAGFSEQYGLNLKKPPSFKALKSLFDYASMSGIKYIDTAELW